MDKETYGLIGYPLGHSFSRKYFTEKFIHDNINAEYLNFEIESVSGLKRIIEENKFLKGLNVTIPHKQNVIPLLDELDETASEIGAVNVIKITHDVEGKIHLKGFNTDVTGFKGSISPMLKSWNKNALILGTGGVSKAINFALKSLGIETLFVSRTPKDGAITYKNINAETMNKYTVIVNASPVGMFPYTDEAPEIPYEHIGKRHVIFDTIYNPPATLFMKLAEQRGAKVKSGMEMLIGQAEAAWKIWNS